VNVHHHESALSLSLDWLYYITFLFFTNTVQIRNILIKLSSELSITNHLFVVNYKGRGDILCVKQK